MCSSLFAVDWPKKIFLLSLNCFVLQALASVVCHLSRSFVVLPNWLNSSCSTRRIFTVQDGFPRAADFFSEIGTRVSCGVFKAPSYSGKPEWPIFILGLFGVRGSSCMVRDRARYTGRIRSVGGGTGCPFLRIPWSSHSENSECLSCHLYDVLVWIHPRHFNSWTELIQILLPHIIHKHFKLYHRLCLSLVKTTMQSGC